MTWLGNQRMTYMYMATSYRLPARTPALLEWTYRRTGSDVLVELGTWCGDAAPGLGMHFHDEAQLVFVLAGARFFLVHSAPVVLLVVPERLFVLPVPGLIAFATVLFACAPWIQAWSRRNGGSKSSTATHLGVLTAA